jgi:hypothetical protein
VCISYGCHNKWPRRGWFKTTEMYSLIVLKTQKSEVKVLATLVPSRVSEGEPARPSPS